MAEVTLGLDLGTSGVKVVALTAAGETLAHATHSYPLLTPQPGWTEQRPQDWAQATMQALSEVATQLRAGGHTPLALGLSGQMHGLTALDAHGEPLRPAPLWNDGRTGEAVEELERRLPRSELIARTGNRAVPGFQLPKLLWLRQAEPETFARVRHALLPKDYLGYLLTGQMHTEASDASGVGALNLTTRAWDEGVLDALELPASLFPQVLDSWAVSGRLKADLAAQTGLPAGLPVVAGGGDNAAAGVALGLSARRPEVGSLSLGTSGVVFAPLTEPTPDPQGRVHLFAHADGSYHLLGVTLAAAGALQWLHDRLAPETGFAALLEEAQSAGPGAGGVTFLPYLSGERSPHMRADLRGSWTGLSLATGRAELTRSLLEATAFALADTYDVMRPLSQVQRLLSTGGGARSDFWLGLVGGALGLEVQRSAREPGAADGAAILAMPAAGLYPDLEAAMEALRPEGEETVRNLDSGTARVAYQQAYRRLWAEG
ncbi:xylulokinase [Deinococcus sonorensis]|uniref:Xylulose kinase n=2 Tax=Deinococcus sonorensis TaxID=309891 RepID=A0AAU7UGF2_9DEIO